MIKYLRPEGMACLKELMPPDAGNLLIHSINIM